MSNIRASFCRKHLDFYGAANLDAQTLRNLLSIELDDARQLSAFVDGLTPVDQAEFDGMFDLEIETRKGCIAEIEAELQKRGLGV